MTRLAYIKVTIIVVKCLITKDRIRQSAEITYDTIFFIQLLLDIRVTDGTSSSCARKRPTFIAEDMFPLESRTFFAY